MDARCGHGIGPGAAFIANNDPNDANVFTNSAYQQDWVRHIVSKWGAAANGGLRYYVLDNEHTLWHSTHRDVWKTGIRAAEVRDLVLDYAARIKAVDPGVGPEEWGWSGFIFSGYDQDWGSKYGWSNLPERSGVLGGMDYVPWLLKQWKAAGSRPIDVFSLHFYPHSGEYSNDVSPYMQQMRNKSTRSLWDPNYTDPSWIQSKVRLIPRMREWVNTHYYPGTPIALTEIQLGRGEPHPRCNHAGRRARHLRPRRAGHGDSLDLACARYSNLQSDPDVS